jgi:hypothetical protein
MARAPKVESKPPVSRPQKGTCRDAGSISLQSLEAKAYLGAREATIFSKRGSPRSVLETDGEDMQNREHICFFSAAHAAKEQRDCARSSAQPRGFDLPLARATKEQYNRMVAEGLGELDKSGIAGLTFKDRHKHSGDRL